MAYTFSKLRRIQAQAQALMDEKMISFEDEALLPAWKKFTHFWVLVFRSFYVNRCPVRASSLAYTTLLSLVPVLAVVLGVAAGMLTKDAAAQIEKVVTSAVSSAAKQLDLMPQTSTGSAPAGVSEDKSKEVATRILEYSKNLRTGTLTATGLLALVFIGISLLATIEGTFNDIWGVVRGRSWFTRVVQYWAALTLGPLLLLSVLLFKTMSFFGHGESLIQEFGGGSVVGKFLVPIFVLTMTFALLYQLMPNTKVDWKAALLGGAVAAVLWELNRNMSFTYASQVIRNSQIYGGLGALPVFLIALYFSWLILLFGAQFAYAFQNRSVYFQEKRAEGVNQQGREFVALRLMTYVAERFDRGEKPVSKSEIAENLGVPSRLVGKVIEPLLETKLLVEVVGPEICYAPGRPLGKITYLDILEALRSGLGQELKTRDDMGRKLVTSELCKVRAAEKLVASSINLQAVVLDLEKLQAAEALLVPAVPQIV